jgi:hypothetical protein
MEALAFDADPDEHRRAFLFEGVSWRNQYTRLAHGELTRELIREDDAWTVWRSGAGPEVRRARRERAATASPPPPPPLKHVRAAKRSTAAVVDTPPPAVDVASSEELAQRIRQVVGGRVPRSTLRRPVGRTRRRGRHT